MAEPTWPGTHDEDDSLVARLDRALSLTGPHDRPSVGDLTIAQEHIRRVRQAIDEGGIRCRRGHYTAHDDVIGDPNSPRWKCSHCVRVGVDAQTIVDGMTGVSTTPDPAALAWETDETRTEWGVQFSGPLELDPPEVDSYSTEEAARKWAVKMPQRYPMITAAAVMSRVVQHRETAWRPAAALAGSGTADREDAS